MVNTHWDSGNPSYMRSVGRQFNDQGSGRVGVVFFQIVNPGVFWTYFIHNRKGF